ncbi:MAG: hypothetical protein ACYDCB_10985, partial [Candidatus Dormibacteria bacterium]
MAPTAIALLGLLLVTFAWSGYRFSRLLRPLTKAAPENRFDQPMVRLWGVATNVGGHTRLLKIRYSGMLHLMIFSGFVVLLTAVVQEFGKGLVPGFSLAIIGGNNWIALVQEIFEVLVLVGLAMAAYNRYVRRPERFQGSNERDATVILVLIFCVVASLLLHDAFRIAEGHDPSAAWRPFSSALAALAVAAGIHGVGAQLWAHVFYWTHILAILGFLAYIPTSKHLHV